MGYEVVDEKEEPMEKTEKPRMMRADFPEPDKGCGEWEGQEHNGGTYESDTMMLEDGA